MDGSMDESMDGWIGASQRSKRSDTKITTMMKAEADEICRRWTHRRNKERFAGRRQQATASMCVCVRACVHVRPGCTKVWYAIVVTTKMQYCNILARMF
mmetsp:Transcript_25174/g.53674  ORF Transcript_25174/g.53674 Transcript_25174/m.53674 type:complete len:99 (-) Transcript_25174:166-462(-)